MPSAHASTRPAHSADCPPCRLGHQYPEGSHLRCVLSASLKGGFRSRQSGGNVQRSAPHGLPTRQPYPAMGLPARGPAAQPRHSGLHWPPPHHTSGLLAGKGLTLSLPPWRSHAGAQLFSVPGSRFPGGPVAEITGSEALSCRCLSPRDRMRVSSGALQGWTALVSSSEYSLPSGCRWCSVAQLCLSLDPADGRTPGSPVLCYSTHLSPTEGHLGCFQLLTLKKEAAPSISADFCGLMT